MAQQAMPHGQLNGMIVVAMAAIAFFWFMFSDDPETVPADLSEAEVEAVLEEGLQDLQSRLPINGPNGMVIRSITRSDRVLIINGSMDRGASGMDAEAMSEAAKPYFLGTMCREATMVRLLALGVSVRVRFTDRTGWELAYLTATAADC